MRSLDNFPGGVKAKLFDPDLYGLDVRSQVAATSQHQGLFGIEIELEGTRLPDYLEGGQWTYHQDGSLRAVNGIDRGGAEYVLTQPLDLEPSKEAVASLFEQLRTRRATIQNSYRCSTHVHVNMRGMKLNQLASFVTYWACFEDVLAEFCGEGRSGNLFALRLSDSSYAVENWVQAFKTGDFNFNRDHRYLALNPACLATFGSLEVRTMRGISNPEELNPWLDALNRLRERASVTADPRAIAMDFSALGPTGVLRQVFDGLPILEALLVQENVDKRIRNGFRLIQPLIYALPWDDILPEIEKIYIHDPFGAPKPARQVRRNIRLDAVARAPRAEPDWEQ